MDGHREMDKRITEEIFGSIFSDMMVYESIRNEHGSVVTKTKTMATPYYTKSIMAANRVLDVLVENNIGILLSYNTEDKLWECKCSVIEYIEDDNPLSGHTVVHEVVIEDIKKEVAICGAALKLKENGLLA